MISGCNGVQHLFCVAWVRNVMEAAEWVNGPLFPDGNYVKGKSGPVFFAADFRSPQLSVVADYE
ncbi:MAG: hypothetical protein FD123_1368 [Bacteroidetes bacterium]|nr:MAG: hypothetical protein FD123_1368 [Bacteroidota bacterium]